MSAFANAADWAIDALVEACGALNKGAHEHALSVIREALWSHAAPNQAVPAGGPHDALGTDKQEHSRAEFEPGKASEG